MSKTGKAKKTIIIFGSVIILLIFGLGILSIVLYNANINVRCDDYKPTMLHLENFEGLKCTEYSFPSDKGQKLAGCLYSNGENQHGIVIIAHGFGAGHNGYMECANYFAKNGYYVFAYDATGSGKSEGEGIGGTPQGVIDLDYAVSFVESNDDIPDLPIVLFGYSWGGYSVCSVLTYHPEIKAVIECSGFDRASDMFESGGKSQADDFIYIMMPFIRMYEYFKYGKYATNTAMDGFESTDASVMIVHSEDDDLIKIEYGLDKYYEKYKDSSRFTFIRFKDRGHTEILNDPENTYQNEFNTDLKKWAETLDYDYKGKENKEQFTKDKDAYVTEYLDHDKWSNRLDKELFSRFLLFYDEAVK